MPRWFLIALMGFLVSAAYAEPEKGGDEPEPTDSESQESDAADESFAITAGAVTIDGDTVEYAATAGKLVQKNDALEAKAEFFFVAYTRGPLDDDGRPVVDRTRPVTFCFNGGPGSSSVWLHLGMLGPRRVCLPDDASFPTPPFGVVDNPYSLLDVTDLVFIDPVGTGYSRPVEGESKDEFHGFRQDIDTVARFIHDYTTRYERWRSPKFVLGESYGGLRAGGLAKRLSDRYRMYLNGTVLVSAVLDFATLKFAQNNDLPYVLFLPGYAATAWRHGALSDELQAMTLEEVVAEAESFALGPYADALLRGHGLPSDQRAAVAAQMARLTGLSVDYVEAAKLRVAMWEFSKELLRDENRIVGRFDSRYTGPGYDANAATMDYDPSGAAFSGIFSGAMNAYLREGLKYEDERVYRILGNVQPWDYGAYENRYVTSAGMLAEAMTANPSLRVFAACGHYDLATPPFAMEHTRDHAMTRPGLQDRFTMAYYEAGHMMYVHEPSLVKLREDLRRWYAETLGETATDKSAVAEAQSDTDGGEAR